MLAAAVVGSTMPRLVCATLGTRRCFSFPVIHRLPHVGTSGLLIDLDSNAVGVGDVRQLRAAWAAGTNVVQRTAVLANLRDGGVGVVGPNPEMRDPRGHFVSGRRHLNEGIAVHLEERGG